MVSKDLDKVGPFGVLGFGFTQRVHVTILGYIGIMEKKMETTI